MAEYILRDDAEKALLERCKETGYGGMTPDDIRLVMRTPWRIPTADVVERKRGKWIEYPEVLKLTDALNDEYIGCSVCETVWNMMGNDVERFNFCPNCGADMREENDDG